MHYMIVLGVVLFSGCRAEEVWSNSVPSLQYGLLSRRPIWWKNSCKVSQASRWCS